MSNFLSKSESRSFRKRRHFWPLREAKIENAFAALKGVDHCGSWHGKTGDGEIVSFTGHAIGAASVRRWKGGYWNGRIEREAP